jgi:aspartyl-tRNA(Asn)/glutamyl-tRNA(Gln) amidotransferase subunit A
MAIGSRGVIAELGERLRRGEISAREIADRALAGAEELNPQLQAFVVIDHQGAREAANRVDAQLAQGIDPGPLAGIPVGVKDIIDMAGHPTRCGSPAYGDKAAERDAPVVERLRTAGATIVGKTTTHELACGVISSPASNPWDTARIPGGSSGGSGAAVSAGITAAALGSDTGGSIRIPASLCGTAGLKGTYGRVPRSGVAALSWSLDHIGPLAPTPADCILVQSVISGYHPDDPTTLKEFPPDGYPNAAENLEGVRLGIIERYRGPLIQPAVSDAFEAALGVFSELGAELIPVEIRELDTVMEIEFALVAAEGAAYHRELVRKAPHLIDPSIRNLFATGLMMPTEHYLTALQGRERIRKAVRGCFEANRLTAAVLPTLAATAARKDQETFNYGGPSEDVISAYVRTTAPSNLTGLPTLSVPCGFDPAGLPIGLQIMGRPLAETEIARIGQVYHDAANWDLAPPVQV